MTTFSYKTKQLKFTLASNQVQKINLEERNNLLYFHLRANYNTLTQYSHFILRVSDYNGPSWDNPCSSGGIQTEDTTSYSTYNIGSNGINGDQQGIWQSVSFYHQATPNVNVLRYLSNNQNVKIYYATKTAGDFRKIYGTCRFYSNPAAPIVQNRTGQPIDSQNGGISIGSKRYFIQLEQFIQCSGYPLTTEMKLSSNQPLPSFIKFDPILFTLTITPNQASAEGILNLVYSAFIIESSGYSNSTNIQIEFLPNSPPKAIQNFQTDIVIFAH
ncbi:UNKNOWN [Stylonychia lemnae]|uniref:Uncharacterized protein n=1 Tax=Stylonychia lemnae TaxID=5949 RepID=A0A078ATX6_STYLE|nr:UNKNOWN [Stylonychia lemnae]|eukprot:CDW85406.1 UNKNOWN [Stylonychia lemnae]